MLSCHWGRFVCTCRPVYLQTSFFDFVLLCSSLGSTAVVVEYSYPMWERLNVSTAKVIDSRGSITSGGAGEPFSPGRAPQSPPQMFIRGGGGSGWVDWSWVGGCLKTSKTPSPL